MTGTKIVPGVLALVVTLMAATASAAPLSILVADDLYSADPNESLAFLADVLAEHDITYMANTDDNNLPVLTNNLDYLLNFDVVIFYKSGIDHAGRLLTPAEYDALLAYVEAGGNLIVTGPSILTAQVGGDILEDDLAADLVGSATVGTGVVATYWRTLSDDNFFLNGPFGDLRGQIIDLGAAVTHDKLLADDTLGAFPLGEIDKSGFDKVIFTAFPVPGGSVGAWTGNEFCYDWDPAVADGELGAQILNNWLVDDDDDGVLDGIDNCPETPNTSQADADGDGYGDSCEQCDNDPDKIEPGQCGCDRSDADSDQDGVANCVDNCPLEPNPSQADRDDDGIGDACDVDPGRPVTVVCGLGAGQTLVPIMLGLGLVKMGYGRIRRRSL